MASPVQHGFSVCRDAATSWGPQKMTVRKSMLTTLLLTNTAEYAYEYDYDSDYDSGSETEGECVDSCNSQHSPCFSPGSQPIDIPRSPNPQRYRNMAQARHYLNLRLQQAVAPQQ